jgi:hypothetical protein
MNDDLNRGELARNVLRERAAHPCVRTRATDPPVRDPARDRAIKPHLTRAMTLHCCRNLSEILPATVIRGIFGLSRARGSETVAGGQVLETACR